MNLGGVQHDGHLPPFPCAQQAKSDFRSWSCLAYQRGELFHVPQALTVELAEQVSFSHGGRSRLGYDLKDLHIPVRIPDPHPKALFKEGLGHLPHRGFLYGRRQKRLAGEDDRGGDSGR